MARPIINRSNFWTDACLNVLWWAARRAATPRVSAEELLGIGWWTVVRYGGDIKYMPLHCLREMIRYVRQEEKALTREGEIEKASRIDLRNDHEFRSWLNRRFKVER